MNRLPSIKSITAAICITLSGVMQTAASHAATLNMQVVNFNKVGATIQFDLYMSTGTAYPNGNTLRGLKSSNIRFEIQGVGGGVLDISGAVVSNINTAYVDMVAVTPAPGADQYAGTTDRFSVQVARNTGLPGQADIPVVATRMATITLPISSGTYTNVLTKINTRTATTSNGSFWNDLTNTAQTFNQINTNAPLPLGLVDFTARATSDNRVQLEWTAADESQNAAYTLERSAEGKDFDATLANVPAQQSSTPVHNYVAYDSHPLSGLNFYRLRVENKNGNSVYSKIRQVYFDGNMAAIYVYPTDNTTGNVQVDLPAGYEQATISVMNILGKKISTASVQQGLKRTISLAGQAPGQYLVHVSQSGRQQTFKVNYQP